MTGYSLGLSPGESLVCHRNSELRPGQSQRIRNGWLVPEHHADIRSISLEAVRLLLRKIFSKSDQWGDYQRENLRHQCFSKGKFNASYLQPWISIISIVFKQEINSRKKATLSMPFSSEKFDVSALWACDLKKMLLQ